MVARYDNQDTIIAVGSSDGIIRLYNVNTQNLLLEVNTNSGNDKYPATALRWKPINSDANVGSSSILATNASGRTI
jgi:WD40 repeat protein